MPNWLKRSQKIKAHGNTPIIAAELYCAHCGIDYSFIQALEQSGLVSTAMIEDKMYVPWEQLPELEKYTRLHYDLHINVEGIETIAHLLNQVQHLQQEIMQLRNQLAG